MLECQQLRGDKGGKMLEAAKSVEYVTLEAAERRKGNTY